MIYMSMVKLLHVSAFSSAILRGIQERKIHSWLAISQTCNNRSKTHNIKWLKNVRSILQNVHQIVIT